MIDRCDRATEFIKEPEEVDVTSWRVRSHPFFFLQAADPRNKRDILMDLKFQGLILGSGISSYLKRLTVPGGD